MQLVNVARRALEMANATATSCAPLTAEQREKIVSLIEPFKTRPVNLAFLMRAIGPGLASELMDTKGTSGKALKTTVAATEAQAKVSGTLNDVGDFNAEDAAKLLPGDSDEQRAYGILHMGDAPASKIFDQIASASPEARGPIIRQLAKMNRLDFFCDHIPLVQRQALAREVDRYDPQAASLLHADDENHGQSINQLYMTGVDDQLEKGNTGRAFGLFLLKRVHNMTSGGFVDSASEVEEQHNAGLTTNDQRSAGMTKALGKAAAVTGVGAMTGGLAGEALAGAAGPLDQMLFKGASTLVGAGGGGFAGGVGAHFAGDAYDHAVNGKEGWDSASDYLESGAMGAGMGLALAGVGLTASKFMPEQARTMASVYAERYPRMTALLEEARQFGVSSREMVGGAGRAVGQQVVMTWKQVQDMVQSGGMQLQPATARASSGADVPTSSIDPDARVRLTVKPLKNLNAPMQMAGGTQEIGGAVFGIEDVELDTDLGYGNVGYDEVDASMYGESLEETAMNERQGRVAGLSKEGGAFDEHHVCPQEERAWFNERGMDVDDYVVDLRPPDHQAQHGGGDWKLARKVAADSKARARNGQERRPEGFSSEKGFRRLDWKHWNAEVMERLKTQEARLRVRTNNPSLLLTQDEILDVVQGLMRERGIDLPMHRYGRRQ